MTDEKTLQDTFALMREGDIEASDALMDRIMLDADNVLADSAPVLAPTRERPSFGARLLDAIGGWPSFGGLAAATVAGLWIGVSPPMVLSDFSEAYLGSTVSVPVFETDIYAGLDL